MFDRQDSSCRFFNARLPCGREEAGDGLCGRTRISMTIRSSWALADFRFPMKNQISNSEKHIKKEPILMNRFFDAEEGI